eukprot:scaffold22740_cov139-Cylindrotheca_fusiformis.AAC.8
MTGIEDLQAFQIVARRTDTMHHTTIPMRSEAKRSGQVVFASSVLPGDHEGNITLYPLGRRRIQENSIGLTIGRTSWAASAL